MLGNTLCSIVVASVWHNDVLTDGPKGASAYEKSVE
jgi:hypothetical protein